jgi:hypothetical protein
LLVDGDDDEYKLIKWAHDYNGYARLARDPENLWRILQPVREEFERSGKIAEWAGVDLLRGWAFYLVRAHRHGGHRPLHEEYPEFVFIVDAINRHPDARAADRSPQPQR